MEIALGLLDRNKLTAIAVMILLWLVSWLCNELVVKPRKVRRMLTGQGLGGPHQTLVLGNIWGVGKELMSHNSVPKSEPGVKPVHHDCARTLFPSFMRWRKQYGEMFVFGVGQTQSVYVANPEVVRAIARCTTMDLGIPTNQEKWLSPLLGQGVANSNGTNWAHQRKTLAPELYASKIKGMLGLINESTSTVVKSWESLVEAVGGVADIEVSKHMHRITGDVISRTCFGRDYTKGKKIFEKQNALMKNMARDSGFIAVPGMRYVPTKRNRAEVRMLILQIVKERKAAETGGTGKTDKETDLLGVLLEGAVNMNRKAADKFVVDNCKTLYTAGFESTSIAATWCLMLLAANPDWQDRVRSEALEICGGGLPDYDMLLKMKQILLVDACEHPEMYMPFGMGPRVCLGQNLAMVELRVVLARILCNFTFTLSPKYVHSPVFRLVIEPKFGINLLVKKF